MAQTLKFGNGTWATKKGSTLAYNDEDGNFKPLPFTYTGAGKGTRVNKEGLIEVVENDRPRIDYTDSEDGVFLLEKAATNLVTYSEAFDNSSWTKNNSTITSGFTSPDGTTNAFKLIEDTSVGEHSISVSPLVGVSDLSISIFVKYAGSEYIVLRSNSSGGSYLNCTFNLLKGVNTFNGFQFDFEITSMPNGWYRISGTNRSSASAFRVNSFILSPTDVQSNSTPNHTGDGTSGVYIYGAQIEAGNLSSYIPTQGTIQTRVAETASGSGNSEVFNDSEGVLYFEGSALANDGTYRYISLSDGSNSNNVRVFLTPTSNQMLFEVISGASLKFNYTNNNINVLLNTKILVKYKQSDFSIWINGFNVNSSVGVNGGNTPIGLDRLNFDRGTGDTVYYSKTKEVAYYDTVLTDLELEALTSYRTWEAMVKELNLNVIYNG